MKSARGDVVARAPRAGIARRALLIYPAFPRTYWSYERILALVGRKVLLPPLGLITAAALLPGDWECRLVDCNIRPVSDEEWDWAEIVLLSAMIVQREDFVAQINEARRRGKPTAVGGPLPTSMPQVARAAGADYLVLDEGEITIPLFVAALAQGAGGGEFRSGGTRPPLSSTPVPRFELLEFAAYDSMAVQFSRGCPFQCEFCDIIVLYGRVPRTKNPAQVLAELQRLFELGWRGGIFMVDDNFIGHAPDAKGLLRELSGWQNSHGYPFCFDTEASVDLARDPELIELMLAANFATVFLGLETPDIASLERTRKSQNTREPLEETVATITRAGLRVMAGFIIGFDGEAPGAGARIVDFVERTAIPTALLSMLQALPGTALWERLEREGRLRGTDGTISQTTLMNFEPSRPVEEIASEFVEAFHQLYDPVRYLDRTYRYFLKLTPPPVHPPSPNPLPSPGAPLRRQIPLLMGVRGVLKVFWRQGFRRATRWKFWHHLVSISRRNPRVTGMYLVVCAHNEHFLEYREIIRREINAQI